MLVAQLASETLILREQLLRTKTDSRGADNALANAQEDLAAALSRAQACEEAYEPLYAELESLKGQLKAADGNSESGVHSALSMRAFILVKQLFHCTGQCTAE